jgi:tetratricopeptide (TPR) repeat protein
LEEIVHSRQGVIHLHGHWRQPESVVFGLRTYDEIVKDERAQLLLSVLRYGKTMVFIGCGAGLEDPDFKRFRGWLEALNSPYPSFRLCLESEVQDLQCRHENENVRAVAYGKDYDELAPFLKSLAQRGCKRPANTFVVAPTFPAASVALPPRPARCLGRDDEVQRVVNALLMPRSQLMPVIGPPGVGKSTVALSALYHPDVVTRFGARRYFVRCEGLRSAAALAESLARYLGVSASDEVKDGLERVLDQLMAATDPVALVLDNLETPWELDEQNVEDALGRLASIPSVAIVATKRGRDRTKGVPWDEAVHLRPFSRSSARQTFLALAGNHFAEDAELDALLDDVDLLPLAVTLMAHFAEPQPNLTVVRQQWSAKKTTMLSSPEEPNRSQNLDRSLDLSMASPRLKPAARRLLQMLACVPAGLWASDVPEFLGSDANTALNSARRCALVEDDAERVRMLSPIREYVSKHHEPPPEDRATLQAFFMQLAKQGNDVGTSSGRSTVERLTPEAANIDKILEDLVSAAPALSQDLVDAILAFGKFVFFTRGSAVTAIPRAIQLANKAGDTLSEATLLQRLGDVARARAASNEAEQHYDDALVRFKAVGSKVGMANCLHCLGDVAFQRAVPDRDRALELYEQALQLYVTLPDSPTIGEANCVSRIGDVFRHRKDPRAVEYFTKALELNKSLEYVHGQAWCLEMLATLDPDPDRASKKYAEARDLHRKGGTILGEANCLYALGVISAKRRRQGSTELFESARKLYQVVPDPVSVGRCHMQLGRLARDSAEARAHIELARSAFADRKDLLAELRKYEAH